MNEAQYTRIVADIRARIAAGDLRPGDRVPSARQITREWGVAIATATKAHAVLRRDGLVRAVPGIGTVVAAAPVDDPGPRPARRREPRDPDSELTRDRIVRAAIAIADAEGLAALSMRRVATDLEVATMSLYRHVQSKDDLVMQMADAVFAGAPLPDPPAGWRAQLELIARWQWTHYRRHPWLAPFISMTRPQLVPSGMVHTERVLAALDGLGLDPATTLHVTLTVLGFVRGVAVNLEPEAHAEQDTGLTSDEWMAAQDRRLREIFASGRFPMLSRLASGPDIEADLDTVFEFGLGQLLDGLALRLHDL
jgi:AcrR family transcriptional regulator